MQQVLDLPNRRWEPFLHLHRQADDLRNGFEGTGGSGLRRAENTGLTEICPQDTNEKKLDLFGRISQKLARQVQSPLRFTMTRKADRALHGAAYVVTTVRPDNEEGRIQDERIALSLGVLDQETTGPGGFAMALRSIPVKATPESGHDDQHAGEGYAGVALNLIDAMDTGVICHSGLNVRNEGAIEELADDDVVEVSCEINKGGIHPLKVGRMPEAQSQLELNVKRYERLAVKAIAEALRAVDVFLPNSTEALALTGAGNVEAALGVLSQYCGTTVIKCGGGGAIAVQVGVRYRVGTMTDTRNRKDPK